MTVNPAKVGIIGCGNISAIYCQNAQKLEAIALIACADLVPERAQAKADDFNCRACSPEDLLADPDIEIVLNLTTPDAHAAVALQAIEAGKNVYNEKPLAIAREDAKKILDSAKASNLLVGCAPDTFMGAGLQTCRKLIDDGAIGRPVAATAFMMIHGHESWHPDPEFYYKLGGGPMLDMGPYYLTALVSLIGPVHRVTGAARITFPERTITSEPKRGAAIQVEVPTHVVGVMDFESGAIGAIITSFDIWAHRLPFIEVYGSEATLSLPDPNTFGGPVHLRRADSEDWEEVSLTHGYAENSRGLGVADMACALRSKRAHRASGDQAHHVLDIMHAIHDASAQGKHIELASACPRPAPLPTGLTPNTLDP